jgi:hypothetical protein
LLREWLPNSTGFKVRLVLEELVLNLIDHAVGSVTDRISVAVDLQPGRVVLVVSWWWRTTALHLIRARRRHFDKAKHHHDIRRWKDVT